MSTISTRLTRWLGVCVLTLAILCLGDTRASAQAGASPCDSVSVAATYKGDCCYEFTLTNTQHTYFLNALQANLLGGTGVVTGAAGPYTTTNTSTTINWSFPNGIPATQSGLRGCFSSSTGLISIEFVWLSQGRIVCRDTLRLDCNVHPPDDTCKVDTLRLNTGWNHISNSLDPVGTYSTFWTVIADPSANTSEPRPASHITKYPVWAGPLANTQWMSSYPSATNDTNGSYKFETCFCLNDGAGKVKFVCDLLADDMARVYVNGNLIGTTPAGWAFLNPPTHLDVDITQYVHPGKNCVQVEVVNTSNVAMGFDLAGYVTASSNLAFDKPQCCDPHATIMGMKYWDKNCNGKQDPGEPGLPGWTIKVTDGTNTYTTTTDGLGNYYFTNLTPGTWTVSEVQQIGWQQSAPAFPGTYIVPLSAGQVISNRDFGNCRIQQQGECFEIARDSIWCTQSPTGLPAYQYRFDIRSLINCNGTQTASISVLSPASVSVAPSSFPVSNAWATQNLIITGAGATAGTTVKLLVKVCCVVPGTPENCCYDTVEVRLPDCHQGCFEIVKDTVYCKEGPNGQTIYAWCFQVKNLSPCDAVYFYLIPPAGVAMSPNTLIIGPLAPGATSGTFCVQISGPGAVPGPLTFGVRMCDRTKQCCCSQEVTIKLPDCGKHDCCEGFIKRFGKLSNSASWSGPASVSGWMSAIGTGGAPIIRVEATLANVSINGAPVYGYFNSGSIANPFGATAGVVAPYGHELRWPTIPTGVNMAAPTGFNLNLQFPPMAPGRFKDVIRYCIRFRYTDKNCVTCDTVLCFSRTRYRIIIIDHLPFGTIEKGRNLASSGQTVVDGRLIDSDSGAFSITFPQFPSELGSGRFVGLDVTSSEATIIDASSNDAQFLVAEGVAFGTFEKNPGERVEVGLRYADRNGRNSITHDVMVRYVLDSDPQDTLLEAFSLTLRSDSIRGGDEVKETSAPAREVRTYALHLRNSNGSQEEIDRLVLTTTDGARILAVGPVGDDTSVTVGFRRTDDGQGVASLNGESVTLAADESIDPIYITLSEVGGTQATVRFQTVNAGGQVISEGEVTLGNPLTSSVEGGEGGADVAGTMLRGSYPNPTNAGATINFHLDQKAGAVTLIVSDATGREVARPIDGETLGAGEHVTYVNGAQLPSGTYYYTLRVGDRVETRAMQIVR